MKSIITLVLFAIASCTAGRADSISLTQGGWSAGGPLHLSFSGTDANGDGGIASDELQAFQASWQTPSGGLTYWAAADLQPDGFLFLDVENFIFFAQNPTYSVVSTVFEAVALSSVFDENLFTIAASADSFAPVPEPATALLLPAAAVLMVGVRKLRTKA